MFSEVHLLKNTSQICSFICLKRLEGFLQCSFYKSEENVNFLGTIFSGG